MKSQASRKYLHIYDSQTANVYLPAVSSCRGSRWFTRLGLENWSLVLPKAALILT